MMSQLLTNDTKKQSIVSQAFINNIKLNVTKESLLLQGCSGGEDVKLTIEVLDKAAPALVWNGESLDAVVRCVDEWSKKNSSAVAEIKWQTDLIEFAMKHDDITAIYASGQSADYCEFVVVMEDVTDDNVFSYNEFCFELAERYVNVTDFMVIDEEEADGCHDLLDIYDVIYKRG